MSALPKIKIPLVTALAVSITAIISNGAQSHSISGTKSELDQLNSEEREAYIILMKMLRGSKLTNKEKQSGMKKVSKYWVDNILPDISQSRDFQRYIPNSKIDEFNKSTKQSKTEIILRNSQEKDNGVAKSVFLKYHLLKGKNISVCFFNGSSAGISNVIDVIREFEGIIDRKFVTHDGANVRKCGTAGQSNQIRITFETSGYWSYVGTIAPNDQNKATMGLQGMGNGAVDRGVVRHEMMHALGFEHEQQSPNSDCWKNIDYDAIAATYGWTTAMAKTNFQLITTVYSPNQITASNYDPDSILHYELYPSFYKNGKTPERCVLFRSNANFSSQDKIALKDAYP